MTSLCPWPVNSLFSSVSHSLAFLLLLPNTSLLITSIDTHIKKNPQTLDVKLRGPSAGEDFNAYAQTLSLAQLNTTQVLADLLAGLQG